MTLISLPVALAHWMSDRLADTLDRPLEQERAYALTVIDAADLDPATMLVRAGLIDEGDRRGLGAGDRPDAVATASRVWMLPETDDDPGGIRLSRPNEFARRRPALGVGVMCDEGIGAVLRFDDDGRTVVVEPRRAAGLVLPAVLHWQSFEERRHRGAA